MANFLRDYIQNRGEGTILRTQYGIIDKETGEHLVPVQHADLYFSDMELFNMLNPPNQGFVTIEIIVELPIPQWTLKRMNSMTPNMNQLGVYDVDGSSGSINFDGSIEWADGETYDVTEVEMLRDGVKVGDPLLSAGDWGWMGPIVQGSTHTFTLRGKTTDGEKESEDFGSMDLKIKPWRALELSQDLPAAASEFYEGDTTDLEIRVNTASGPGPYEYQWKYNGVDIPLETENKLHFNAVSFSGSGNTAQTTVYACEAKDLLHRTVLSRNHSMSVYRKMEFANQGSPTIDVYENGVLSLHHDITRGGKTPYTYQWFHDDGTGDLKAVGGNNNTLTINPYKNAENAGSYIMKVYSMIGGHQKEESTIPKTTNLVVLAPPDIAGLEIDERVFSGPPVTLSTANPTSTIVSYIMTDSFVKPNTVPYQFALYNGETKLMDIPDNTWNATTSEFTFTVPRSLLPAGEYFLTTRGKFRIAQYGAVSVEAKSPAFNVIFED